MKIKNILLTAVMAALSLTAWADLTNGEYGYMLDGSMAKMGQPTLDHLFVRGDYEGVLDDNKVVFDQGDTKLVWMWLDDDHIYLNEGVQALIPVPYNSAGDLYNEITYNSFQCDLYLPENVSLISFEDEETGDEMMCAMGDRMPRSSQFFYELNGTKTIDGQKYKAYKILCANTQNFGCHFSAKSAAAYRANGALKKDDGPLFGLYLKCEGASTLVGEMPNMIIANLEFGFREAFTTIPQWDPNDYRFFYGTGGNNQSQRFQYYQRVRMFGNGRIEFTDIPEIKYSVNSNAVVVTATGQGDVVLMIDGERVDNPCTIERGEQSKTIMATATAQEEGKMVSDVASLSILVPAKPGTSGDNVLTVSSPLYVESGKNLDMPVGLVNGSPISALQCDVFLPEGFTMIGDSVSLVAARVAESHSISMRSLGDGVWRVLIASPKAEVFNGNEGELFVLHLNTDADLPEADYNVMLGNIILADASADTYFAPDVDAIVIVKRYGKGDANGDGTVNVGDYVTTANYIMDLNPDPFVFSAADIDDNNSINVADLVGIVNIVLGDYNQNAAHGQAQEGDVPMVAWIFYLTGDECALEVSMYNEMPLTALQMDINLPDGMTLRSAELSGRAKRHNLMVTPLDNGKVRLLVTSPSNEVIDVCDYLHDGLLTLWVESDGTIEDMVSFDHIVLSERDMTIHQVRDFSAVSALPISVEEVSSGTRIYAQGENIVVETPVDTDVEIIMMNGMSRKVAAKAGTNVYPVGKGIHIVRVAGQVSKLSI